MDISTPTHLAEQATPPIINTKRTRNAGPPRGRPMLLRLISSDITSQQADSHPMEKNDVGRRTRGTLRRMSSFYPGCGDVSECDVSPGPASYSGSDGNLDNDGNTETEHGTDDDDQETVELAEKQPLKFHAAVMLERPSCEETESTSGSSTPGSVSTSAHLKGPEVPLKPIWPVDTNLILGSGSSSNKLNLSVQTMMVHIVVGEAIDNVWATLLFHNAFPDSATAATSLVEDCLLAVAKKYKQGPLSVMNSDLQNHRNQREWTGQCPETSLQ
ncbi:hypothetical protein BC827DRAFT_1274957 [Russula dissimulans]|nr:hypothetical protein BC827DRAFT_1274957 [Russula dissimulans]